MADQIGGQMPLALRVAGVPLITAALMATTHTPAHAVAAAQPSGPLEGGRLLTTPGRGPVQAAVPATYTVKPGDTVTHISARTRIPVQAIMTANHLPASGLLLIGQQLVLPGLKVTPATKPPALAYQVRPGDTVLGIAGRHKISAAAIVAANRLRSADLIHPGQRLTLPGVSRPASPPTTAKPAAPERPPTRTYVVKSGDSLIGISQSQKVPLATVLKLNALEEASVIHPGQKLLLPAPPKPKVPNTFLGRTYPDAVAQAAAANRATLAKRAVPSRGEMRAMVIKTARAMGVDPALAMGVAYQESGFNQRAVSPANAIGTMQVIPSTGKWASDLVGRKLDLLLPQDNVTAGVAVLAALLARADQDDAIAGYYQGLASVRSRGMYKDTKAYVASVKAHRARFAKELAAR